MVCLRMMQFMSVFAVDKVVTSFETSLACFVIDLIKKRITIINTVPSQTRLKQELPMND